jgi:hypothetical protein
MANTVVQIKAPNLQTAIFEVVGDAPLVVHRFSHKVQLGMLDKMAAGSTAKKGKSREAVDTDDIYNEARYYSSEGWDGFNASAVRNSLISACRLVGFKMTLAKMSVFVIPDGWDAIEPHIPLIRIYGDPRKLEMHSLVETGTAYMSIRPCYDNWSAKVKLHFDADQFTLTDVSNLLARVGAQVGWCEGRPDSKNSAGMGWGIFHIKNQE